MTSAVDRGHDFVRRFDRVWSGLVLGGVGLATVAAGLLGGSSPFVAVVPVLLLAMGFLATKVPLRWSVAVLLFLVLAVDVPKDAAGLWNSPFVGVGVVLQGSLDKFVPGLKVSGVELVVVFLLGLSAFRAATGNSIDAHGRVRTARVLRDFLLLYVAGLLFAEVNGLLRGAPAAPWKIRNLIQVPVLFLLFQAAFRGPVDQRLIGRVVVAAASVKAVFAIWVQSFVAPTTGGPLDFATNHGDSVLFAVATFLLVAHLVEKPDRASILISSLLLPLLVLGMLANGRRIVWVMLAMTLVALYLISSWRPWKLRATRAGVFLVPVVAIYVAVGWSSSSGVFAPIRTLRSVSDGTVDASTLWREIENWNICMSIRASPILGIGLGGQYTEFRHNGDLTAFYPDYRAWPHNSVLGLLLLAGVVGFTAMWLLHAVTVFLAARSYHLARAPDDRTAALTGIAAIIACMGLAFGDLGPNFLQYRVFWALALAVVGKLAVATHAWPGQSVRQDVPMPTPAVPRRPVLEAFRK